MSKKVVHRNTDRSVRYTEARIKKAIIRAGGMVSTAAKKLGCTPMTIYNRMEKSPALAETVRFQRDLFIDEAEYSLREAVAEKEGWAVCFTLKTIGKGRGYIERPEYQPVQSVVVQQAVVEAQPYDLLLTMLRTLTMARVIPPDILASFVIPKAINGYDGDGK